MFKKHIIITALFSFTTFNPLFAMENPNTKLKSEQERDNRCIFNRWALKQITDKECDNFIFPKDIRDYIGKFNIALETPISFKCPTVEEFKASLDHAITNDETININANNYNNGIKIFPGKYFKITFQNSDGIVFVGYTRYFDEKSSWLDLDKYKNNKYNFTNTQVKVGHKNIYFEQITTDWGSYPSPKFPPNEHPIASISCLYGHESNPKEFEDHYSFVELAVDFKGMQLSPARISYPDGWDYEKNGSSVNDEPFLFYNLNKSPTFNLNR